MKGWFVAMKNLKKWRIRNGTKTVLDIHSNIVSKPIGDLDVYTEKFCFVANKQD